jgi:hypothetical protein
VFEPLAGQAAGESAGESAGQPEHSPARMERVRTEEEDQVIV